MRQLRQLLILAIAALGLQACTAMLMGGGTASETTASATPSSADQAISASIRQSYSHDAELSHYAIGIRTLGGRVTLSGTVGSYPARDRATSLARDTSGVLSVDSRIIVNTNL